MKKFHINKNGVPGPCNASKRGCPLGGPDQHYHTIEEAQSAADKINELEFGGNFLPVDSKSNLTNATTESSNDDIFPTPGFHYEGSPDVGLTDLDYEEFIHDDEIDLDNKDHKHAIEVYKAFGPIVGKKVFQDETLRIVREKDAEFYVKNELLNPDVADWYSEYHGYLEKNNPELIDRDTGYINDKELGNLTKHLAKKKIESTPYSLNGERLIIDTYEKDEKFFEKGWIDKYVKSKG